MKPSIEVQPVLDDPLSVLSPPDARATHPADWGAWVSFPMGSHSRALIADALRRAGASFDVVAESHQPEVLREMVLLGIGWTVLPLAGLASVDDLRLVEPALTVRRLVLARRAGAPPDPALDALADTLLSR